jgi:hypothetical protein
MDDLTDDERWAAALGVRSVPEPPGVRVDRTRPLCEQSAPRGTGPRRLGENDFRHGPLVIRHQSRFRSSHYALRRARAKGTSATVRIGRSVYVGRRAVKWVNPVGWTVGSPRREPAVTRYSKP